MATPCSSRPAPAAAARACAWWSSSEDFAAALASCQREAINSFGNDAVLVEKYVLRPRHIEIQVFGDTHGNCVYLFERDCSVQRRHQKVLEEAPAPGMTEALRRQMGEAAVAAAQAVGYVGAGTVEFIVEQPGGYEHPEQMKFYFMEMNTRLQVEHPVTEAITGEDLVEWQLRVAAGQPLPKQQDELRIIGHAIEARICAENPDNQLPARHRHPGRSTASRHAAALPCSDVRVDDGVREGDAISPFYDRMIAKLIVHGDTRAQALARLDAALAQTHIVGLATNVQFLRHVVRSPAFAQAQLDTALIAARAGRAVPPGTLWPRRWPWPPPWPRPLLAEQAQQGADPFSRRDGWHSHGSVQRRFALSSAGEPLEANADLWPARQPAAAGGRGRPQGRWHWQAQGDGLLTAVCWPAQHAPRCYALGEQRPHVHAPGCHQSLELPDPLAHAGEAATAKAAA